MRSSDTCLCTTGEAQAMPSARFYSLAVVFVLWYFSRASNNGGNEFSDFPFLPWLTNVHCLWQVEVDCYMTEKFLLPESETHFMFVPCLLTMWGETLLVLKIHFWSWTRCWDSQSGSIQLLLLKSTWGCVLEKAGNNGELVSFLHRPVFEGFNLYCSFNWPLEKDVPGSQKVYWEYRDHISLPKTPYQYWIYQDPGWMTWNKHPWILRGF